MKDRTLAGAEETKAVILANTEATATVITGLMQTLINKGLLSRDDLAGMLEALEGATGELDAANEREQGHFIMVKSIAARIRQGLSAQSAE